MAQLKWPRPGWMGRCARFWQTARYLAPAQILSRVRVRLLRRWWRLTDRRACGGEPIDIRVGPALQGRPVAQGGLADQGARVVLSRLQVNEFEFLGESHRFTGDIDWNVPQQSQLWRFHLHYFGYVRELMLLDAGGGDEGFREFRRLSRSWITGNVRIMGDGWHPYTLSLRIINWLKAASFWSSRWEAEEKWSREIGLSLRHQANLLVAQLERDVRGNHLLENGRALVWLGLLTADAGSPRWLERGLKILDRELPEQVLNDGCHFERCPGYHFSILLSLVELCCLFDLCNQARPAGMTDVVRRMAQFGCRILLPDGRYPLLKDSADDQIPVPPAKILAAAAQVLGSSPDRAELRRILLWGEPYTISTTPDFGPAGPSSGFCTARKEGEMLVFDAGAPCPDYLPAHAHADALNFEFHAAGKPIVVDSGIFEYTAGPWRDHFRSTAAHNTLSVDGMNSSDTWGSFRVGRRARVRCLREQSDHGSALFEAEHDGFTHLSGAPRHRRLMAWRHNEWMAVVDRVDGGAVLTVDSFIHFHPDIHLGEPERYRAGWRIALQPAGWFLLVPFETTFETIRGRDGLALQGWRSEQFGRRVAASVVRLAWRGKLPFAAAYVLTPDPELAYNLSPADHGCRFEITRNGVPWSCAMTDT